MKCLPLLAALLLSMTVPATAAAPESQPEPVAASYLDDYARQHDFSGSILISRHGKIVLNRSYGLANRTFDIPN
ncbi:hypothetical protein AB4084_15495, partial [Lysobacter sp. 2RAB21]